MIKKLIKYIGVWIIGVCSGITFYLWIQLMREEAYRRKADEISVVWRQNHFKLNKENLYNELYAQGVEFPEIVLSQAILETGNFKSNACKIKNNLFGLRNSDGTYKDFEHWTDCVAAYKKYIQKYEELPADYYEYLKNLGYSEDSTYIEKLKQIKK